MNEPARVIPIREPDMLTTAELTERFKEIRSKCRDFREAELFGETVHKVRETGERWTQEAIAEVLGCKRVYVSYRIRLYEFVEWVKKQNVTVVTFASFDPHGVPERRFREYERVACDEGIPDKPDLRFKRVAELLMADAAKHPGWFEDLARQLTKFADGKKHTVEHLLKHMPTVTVPVKDPKAGEERLEVLPVTERDLKTFLHRICRTARHGLSAEYMPKTVFKIHRASKGREGLIDRKTLLSKLAPMLAELRGEGLKEWFQSNPRRYADLAVLIERAIQET